jgi:hypothetical protein
MAKQRQQLEEFDVAEFLRPTDDDLKSALTSLLRDGNSFDSQTADSKKNIDVPPEPSALIEILPPVSVTQVEAASLIESDSNSSGEIDQTENQSKNHPPVVRPSPIKNYPRTKATSRASASAGSSFDVSLYLKRARIAYRLNRTELVLYEMFLKWTHAIGETRCEATNRKICEESGLIEKTVRRNLKSLRERGLLNLIKAYDPYNHEPAIYDVSLPALGPT